MQVVYHIGAPCTDDDALVQSLLKSRSALSPDGISVPPPGRYRALLLNAVRSLNGRAATPEMQEALLDAIVDEAKVDRLILSDPRFICLNRLVVQGPQIWPMVERQSMALRALWPAHEVEFFIAMRNPATLIPALFKGSRFADFREFTENMQPLALAWSEMVRRLRTTHRDAHIVLWCNEDTPLIWGDILREMAGVASMTPMAGQDDLLQDIMEASGISRMQDFLASHPPASDEQRRRIVAAFLERYARDDVLEESLDLPGWSAELVEQMTEIYEDDIDLIASMDNVTLLLP